MRLPMVMALLVALLWGHTDPTVVNCQCTEPAGCRPCPPAVRSVIQLPDDSSAARCMDRCKADGYLASQLRDGRCRCLGTRGETK